MKAIVYARYGPPDVLHLQEVPKPEPKENEVLVKVHATTASSGDGRIREFRDVPRLFWLPARLVYGLTKPKRRILGMVVSGRIESIGRNVTRFKPGDNVFGTTGMGMGAYAEYVCLPEDAALARKPDNLAFEEAAAIPFGAQSALYFLREAKLQSGEQVLINGAGGDVGSAAVQLAKHHGAEVTGVCSTGKLDFVKSLGADQVIDYTREDFTQSGRTWDIIFDTVGKTSFSRCKAVLKPNGRYVLSVFGGMQLLLMLWTSVFGRKKVVCGVAPERPDTMEFIRELAEAGKLRPCIDRRYSLEQTAEAHRHVDRGHKQGSVVIVMETGEGT